MLWIKKYIPHFIYLLPIFQSNTGRNSHLALKNMILKCMNIKNVIEMMPKTMVKFPNIKLVLFCFIVTVIFIQVHPYSFMTLKF
jgi:hypothetical protein